MAICMAMPCTIWPYMAIMAIYVAIYGHIYGHIPSAAVRIPERNMDIYIYIYIWPYMVTYWWVYGHAIYYMAIPFPSSMHAPPKMLVDLMASVSPIRFSFHLLFERMWPRMGLERTIFHFSRDGPNNVMLLEGIPKHQEKHMSRNDFVFWTISNSFFA